MSLGLRVAFVWSVTITGFVVGCVGVFRIPSADASWWLMSSVVFDVADGWLARRACCATRYGARLDWAVDTALSYAIVVRLLPAYPILAVLTMTALLAQQTVGTLCGARASGRTLVTVATVLWLTMR